MWSAWPEVVPKLALRCLYWGYIWPKVSLTWSSSKLGHEISLLGGMSDQRSAWPEVVQLFATRCLYCGYIWPKVSLNWSSSKLGHKMSLPGGQPAWCRNTLGHEMFLLGVGALCRGTLGGWSIRNFGVGGYIWPKVSLPKGVPNLAMGCLYTGGREAGWGVWELGGDEMGHLTKGHPSQSSTKVGYKMSLLGVAGIRGLGAGGTSDQRSACPK